MSETSIVDEKYVNLQYQLIETKLGNISTALENFGKDIKKVLDDHEQRLRDQAKADAANILEISALHLELKDIRAEHATHAASTAKCIEALSSEIRSKEKKELALWQTVGIEGLKYALFGASSGGIAALILKLVGIIP